MRLVLIALLTSCHPAVAEVPQEGHDLFHQYYKFWYNGRGTHCCNEQHCRPAGPGDFKFENGSWHVNMPDGWRRIQSSDHVVDDGGLGPFGSICRSGDTLFCVDLPDPGI